MNANELHQAIMNLPCKNDYLAGVLRTDRTEGYREGHRDARHAAAKLVLAHSASGEGEKCNLAELCVKLLWNYAIYSAGDFDKSARFGVTKEERELLEQLRKLPAPPTPAPQAEPTAPPTTLELPDGPGLWRDYAGQVWLVDFAASSHHLIDEHKGRIGPGEPNARMTRGGWTRLDRQAEVERLNNVVNRVDQRRYFWQQQAEQREQWLIEREETITTLRRELTAQTKEIELARSYSIDFLAWRNTDDGMHSEKATRLMVEADNKRIAAEAERDRLAEALKEHITPTRIQAILAGEKL